MGNLLFIPNKDKDTKRRVLIQENKDELKPVILHRFTRTTVWSIWLRY